MKDCLIVIDMQNDFIDGVLGSEEAKRIVPKVHEKIMQYDGAGKTIIFTQDIHFSKQYERIVEGKRVPKHCMMGTEGARIPKDVADFNLLKDSHRIFMKHAFGFPEWGSRSITELLARFKEIEIIGLCTDICVISNALILRSCYPALEITVDANCCAGSTPEKHVSALDVMESCCITVEGR